jgi:hypothetical protein
MNLFYINIYAYLLIERGVWRAEKNGGGTVGQICSQKMGPKIREVKRVCRAEKIHG